jgi:hypothetical protein
LDAGRAILIVSKRQGAPPDRLSIAPDELALGKVLSPAVERVVGRWRTTGRLPGALEDFLYRRRPRFLRNPEGPIVKAGGVPLNGAIAAVLDMRTTTLCVQGPPGSGKTFSGSRMIVALLRAGKRVGIASNSHRAINVLLAETSQAALVAEVSVTAAKVCREDDHLAGLPDRFQQIKTGRELFDGRPLPNLIGGAAFAFIQEAAEGALDYLFVDEAGQVSLANLVAMPPAGHNIVLLGDQMQLGQPIQGSHPGESGLSTLEYLLQGQATIPEDFGIFLSRTWRLHPNLCHSSPGQSTTTAWDVRRTRLVAS